MAKSMTQIALRIDRRLREAIVREAERDQRSVAGLIRKVLVDHLDQEERSARIDVRERVA